MIYMSPYNHQMIGSRALTNILVPPIKAWVSTNSIRLSITS